MREVLARRTLTSRFHLEAMQSLDGSITIEVIKTTNGAPIPLDEPLFLLRARDLLAAPLLLCYRALIQVVWYPNSEAKEEHLASNQKAIDVFEKFAQHNPGRMKLPNITQGN